MEIIQEVGAPDISQFVRWEWLAVLPPGGGAERLGLGQADQAGLGAALQAGEGGVASGEHALEFTLDSTLEMDARFSSDAAYVGRTTEFKNEKQETSGLYMLHFNPDGFVSLSSPEVVIFRQGKDTELWVSQSRNRLNYEIQAGRQMASR